MAFFPFERFVIRTHLTPESVRQKLSNAIESRSYWNSHTNHKPFRGTIRENTFEIRRVIQGRNSFQPIMKGRIQSEMGETVVNVTMAPHILVILFMICWLSFAACIFLGMLISWMFASGTFNGSPGVAILFPVVMLVFGYTLMTGAFKIESGKSKSSLQELFDV